MSLQWLKNNWNHPAEGAAAVAIAIASFYTFPAEDVALGPPGSLSSLARWFVIPVTWLILSVPARLYGTKKYVKSWFLFSVISVILATANWVAYFHLSSLWTFKSAELNRTFVRGETFTRSTIDGIKFIERNVRGREISDEEAIRALQDESPQELIYGEIPHNETRIWEGVKMRQNLLTVIYIIGVATFTLALLASLQAWYSAGKPQRKKTSSAEAETR